MTCFDLTERFFIDQIKAFCRTLLPIEKLTFLNCDLVLFFSEKRETQIAGFKWSDAQIY